MCRMLSLLCDNYLIIVLHIPILFGLIYHKKLLKVLFKHFNISMTYIIYIFLIHLFFFSQKFTIYLLFLIFFWNKWFFLLQVTGVWSFCAILFFGGMTLIDSFYYKKFVFVPLNQIKYVLQRFREGKTFFSLENWNFYFIEGLLKFNIVFVFALLWTIFWIIFVIIQIHKKFIKRVPNEIENNRHRLANIITIVFIFYIFLFSFINCIFFFLHQQ